MKKENRESLTPELPPGQDSPAATLKNGIETTEMAPITDSDHAARGQFYRPIKHPLSLRLDADVIAWFQKQGQGYQTRINAALREYIAAHSNEPETSH